MTDISPEEYEHVLDVYAELEKRDEKVAEKVEELIVKDRAAERARQLRNTAARPPVGTLGRRFSQLIAETPPDVPWAAPGFLAFGWITKLAAREKVGKGVFCATLLGQIERGENTVFGPSVQATSLVYTEEPLEAIREKGVNAGLANSTAAYGYELAGCSWTNKVASLVAEAEYWGHRIIYIDNLSRATGATNEEENGIGLGGYVGELGEAAKAAYGGEGVAVLLNHHHRKTPGPTGDMSRGGTALGAVCDLDIEMFRPRMSRVVTLSSIGRVSATNWERAFELGDDDRTYTEVPIKAADDEPSVADQKLMIDRGRLEAMGSTTAEAFADGQDFTAKTASRRLDVLVKNRLAVANKAPGTATVWDYTGEVDRHSCL